MGLRPGSLLLRIRAIRVIRGQILFPTSLCENLCESVDVILGFGFSGFFREKTIPDMCSTEKRGEGEERSDDRSQGWHGQDNEREDA